MKRGKRDTQTISFSDLAKLRFETTKTDLTFAQKVAVATSTNVVEEKEDGTIVVDVEIDD